MASTPLPPDGNHLSSHNSHSSPDNGHVYPSSPPQADPAYDGDPFNDFDPYLSSLEEEHDSNDKQPDLPEDPSQNLPQPLTPLQPRSSTRTPAQNAQQPNEFCQINDFTQDKLTHLMNTPGGLQSTPAEDRLRDVVTRRTVQEQRAAINAASTQASRYPSIDANPVFGNANSDQGFGGYEELPEPSQMLRGIADYANGRGDNSSPLHGRDPFLNRNAFADADRNPSRHTPYTAPVNQQPLLGYVPAQPDEEEASSEREDTPTTSRPTRRRSVTTYTPQARGNRVHPPRSDAHPRFRTNDPTAIADAEKTHTIDRTHHSGRNLMAFFDDSDTPRTRYRLRIESGRSGQHASKAHAEANTEIPSRLSLREICRDYPNHVWGTGLRLFMHEYITAEQIWRYLPANVRMNGCATRPHNYLQQAIGRQVDEMMEEDTGEKRVVIKRKNEDDDEDEEEKPKPKQRCTRQITTTTPNGHRLLAAGPTAQPNLLPFSQRSPTSPFVVQTQQGLVGPRRVIQRPATANTPVPAGGVAQEQPSPTPSPPRTASDLRRLIITERGIQEDITGPLIAAQYGPMNRNDVQARLQAWRFRTNSQLIGRVLRAFNLRDNPVPNNDVVGLMQLLLSRNAGARVPQAVPLATEDNTSRACNWYLYMLREVTVEIGNRRLVEEGNEA